MSDSVFDTKAQINKDSNGDDNINASSSNITVYAGSWFGGTNVGDLSNRTSLNVSIPANRIGCKAFIVVVHRAALTTPSGWELVDCRINKSGWQWISIFSKVVTEEETVTITQASNVSLVANTFFTEANKKLLFENDYWGNPSSNPMQWNIRKLGFPRVFAYSLGYGTTASSTSISYSPSLTGWQVPSSFSQPTIRAMIFYMTGAENSDIIVKYNGMYAGGQVDVGNSSQISSYMIVDE